MPNGNTERRENQETNESELLARKLTGVGWGLFFIWIGIVFLADAPLGIGLLGVGIITLGMQVARKVFNLAFEGGWLIVGGLFVLGGLIQLFNIQVRLVPVLLIVAGVVVLITTLTRKQARGN